MKEEGTEVYFGSYKNCVISIFTLEIGIEYSSSLTQENAMKRKREVISLTDFDFTPNKGK